MKISRDINGNKVLKIAGKDLAIKTGFSIQTMDNLKYTHKNDLHCLSTAKKEVFNYVSEYGTKKQKQDLQVDQDFTLRNMIDQRLNNKPFYKVELSDQDIDQLMNIFGKGCQSHTKKRLRIIFQRVEIESFSSTWFFERINYSVESDRWSYCAGQDYSYEISDIRKELLK